MRLFLLIIISLNLLSCSKEHENKSSVEMIDTTKTIIMATAESGDTTNYDFDSQYKLESYFINTVNDNRKFEVIDFTCAILIYPTHDQIKEMKEGEDDADFYVGADDSNWYQGKAINMIDSVGVKRITATGRFLKLVGKEKTWELDIRKRNLPNWNLIFFNNIKGPEVISTIDLDIDQIRKYFELNDPALK